MPQLILTACNCPLQPANLSSSTQEDFPCVSQNPIAQVAEVSLSSQQEFVYWYLTMPSTCPPIGTSLTWENGTALLLENEIWHNKVYLQLTATILLDLIVQVYCVSMEHMEHRFGLTSFVSVLNLTKTVCNCGSSPNLKFSEYNEVSESCAGTRGAPSASFNIRVSSPGELMLLLIFWALSVKKVTVDKHIASQPAKQIHMDLYIVQALQYIVFSMQSAFYSLHPTECNNRVRHLQISASSFA